MVLLLLLRLPVPLLRILWAGQPLPQPADYVPRVSAGTGGPRARFSAARCSHSHPLPHAAEGSPCPRVFFFP